MSRLRAFAPISLLSAAAATTSTVAEREPSMDIRLPLKQILGLIHEPQWQRLASRRVYFGHQSVGADILRGIRELEPQHPQIRLNIISNDDPAQVSGPALIESLVGHNGDPRSKDIAFRSVLDKGFGRQGGIALYKYCFVDIRSGTDPEELFAAYAENVRALHAQYPDLILVHSTIPLTTVEPAWKATIKRLLGRPAERDVAAKRHHFNQLLRKQYSGREPIFDIAEVECTRLDGRRIYFLANGEKVDTLAPEFTYDGGHLNDTGRRIAAACLLATLARL